LLARWGSISSNVEVPSFEQIFDRYEPLHFFIITCHPRVYTRADIERFRWRLTQKKIALNASKRGQSVYTPFLTLKAVEREILAQLIG
jgi:hypothetical protein